MQHDPEIRQALELYQLGLPRSPAAGRSGELLGRGTGSSLEFQEYRQYFPGDDIRHIDWAAYARSDTLMVRLYRDEISPRTEILLDVSRSMTSGGEIKSRVARQLAGLMALLCARLGGRPQVTMLGDDALPPLGIDGLAALERQPFTGTATLAELLQANRVSMKRQSVRIVISDFLYPHDPAHLIRQLAGDASALWILQILNAWEADPTLEGGRRLIDVETQEEAELVIDQRAIASYRSRLRSLQDELLRNCRRAHGVFVTLIAEKGLPNLCRQELSQSGILRIA